MKNLIMSGAILLVVVLTGCWKSESFDKALVFGEIGIWTIIGVSENDPDKVFLRGPMIIQDNRMVHAFSTPGAVIIVDVDKFTPSKELVKGKKKSFESGHILLCDSDQKLLLAPPGTEIRITQQQTILNHNFSPGIFTVPKDSKIIKF